MSNSTNSQVNLYVLNNTGKVKTHGDASLYYLNQAKDWANKLESTVDGFEYSAKYYANQAENIYQSLEQINTNHTERIENLEEDMENANSDLEDLTSNVNTIFLNGVFYEVINISNLY